MLVRSNFTLNLGNDTVREATLDGKLYLVVNMVMMTEGVHEGTDGPGYYPAEELQDACPAWNHKPIVRYHPEVNGVPVSAADPAVLNEKIGFVLNTSYEGKQRAEAWFDAEKTKAKDERIYNAIVNRQKMELSTGLYLQQEKVKGVWNTESYEWIGRRHKPDHLAILPDRIGACSIADGAGLFANEASFSQIAGQVRKALGAKFGDPGEYWHGYVEEIYQDFVIFCDDDEIQKVSYTVDKNGVVTLGDDVVGVVRVTTYQTKSGTVVANAKALFHSSTEIEMDKKTPLVNQIIANGSGDWTEKDREFLMGKEEKFLQKLATPPVPTQNNTPEPVPQAVPTPVTIQTPTPAPTGQTVMAFNEWLKTAPPEVQTVVVQGLNSLTKVKTDLIARITANSSNTFSAQELQQLDPQALEKIAKLADQQAVNNQQASQNILFPFGLPNQQQVPQFYGAMPPAPNPAPTGNNADPNNAPPVLTIDRVDYEALVSNRQGTAKR